MTDVKKNKIPMISPDRINKEPASYAVGNTREEKNAYAFLRGKEPTQPFTIRIPNDAYHTLRKIAFNKNEKINQIIIQLIKIYNSENALLE